MRMMCVGSLAEKGFDVFAQEQLHIILCRFKALGVHAQPQRLYRRIPAIVSQPELAFEPQARGYAEFHAVRFHDITPTDLNSQ